MHRFFKILSMTLLILSARSYADPWFTGPLLAPAGHTIPNGHTNVEVYGLDINTDGAFDNFGHVVRTPLFISKVINPIITHGYTDWLDVQLNLPYVFHNSQGVRYNRLGDVAVALGFQLSEQNASPKRIDTRIIIQETIPTGRYDRLNALANGTDSTGLGSYQTLLGLNFQYILEVFPAHFLRTRLLFSRLFASPVQIYGRSSYGGTDNTIGRIRPGSENSIDLAFEYTLSQHWVPVMEAVYNGGNATRFNGFINIGNLGGPKVNVGSDAYRQTALAPALEYNFNGNVGLIGGVWFPVSGRNTSDFKTYVLALNLYW